MLCITHVLLCWDVCHYRLLCDDGAVQITVCVGVRVGAWLMWESNSFSFSFSLFGRGVIESGLTLLVSGRVTFLKPP